MRWIEEEVGGTGISRSETLIRIYYMKKLVFNKRKKRITKEELRKSILQSNYLAL